MAVRHFIKACIQAAQINKRKGSLPADVVPQIERIGGWASNMDGRAEGIVEVGLFGRTYDTVYHQGRRAS